MSRITGFKTAAALTLIKTCVGASFALLASSASFFLAPFGQASLLFGALLRCHSALVYLQDVDRLGIGRVMELALEALGVSGKGAEGTEAPLHLSFDIDSVDPKVCVGLAIVNQESRFVVQRSVAAGI